MIVSNPEKTLLMLTVCTWPVIVQTRSSHGSLRDAVDCPAADGDGAQPVSASNVYLPKYCLFVVRSGGYLQVGRLRRP